MLLLLPLVAAFHLPVFQQRSAAFDRSRVAAPPQAVRAASIPALATNALGRRLEGRELEGVGAPFGLSDFGNWYACDAPSDDPTLISFQAPNWMDLAESYVVTDALQSSHFTESSYPE